MYGLQRWSERNVNILIVFKFILNINIKHI